MQKIFLLCVKILYGEDGETRWPTGNPLNMLKNFRVGGKKLGTDG